MVSDTAMIKLGLSTSNTTEQFLTSTSLTPYLPSRKHKSQLKVSPQCTYRLLYLVLFWSEKELNEEL